MPVRSWRRHALGGLLLAGAACAGCGGQAGTPLARPVSLKAATVNPCLLVSQSQAQAILGRAIRKPQVEESACGYGSSATPLVQIQVQGGGVSTSLIAGISDSSPAPVPGVGHSAECGTARLGAVDTTFVSTIGRTAILSVIGPSCAAAAPEAETSVIVTDLCPHFQPIAHRGACRNTPVVPHNRWPWAENLPP